MRSTAIDVAGWRVRLMWLLGLLVLSPGAVAQPAEQARFRHVGLADGLSQPSVKAIAQDRHGFIWFGTQTGLNRFDGQDMRVFTHRRGDAGALSHNNITALALDADGRLWVGTEGGGLCRFDPQRERFELFEHASDAPNSLPDNTVTALLADDRGRLWVGTEAGLARWRPEQGDFQHFSDPAISDPRVRALAATADGRLWIGTVDGLWLFDPERGSFTAPRLDAALTAALRRPVRALVEDRRGQLWVGTAGSGLLRIDPRSGGGQIWRHDPNDSGSLGSDVIGALLQDRDGRLWVAHEAGVDLRRDDAGASAFRRFRHQRRNPHSLGGGRVASLLQDRDGGLWFGTWSGGASLLSPLAWRVQSFTPDTPETAELIEPEILALAAEEPATLWLGTRNGLFAFDVAEHRLRSYPSTRGARIYGIVRRGDELLLGTERGLQRFDPAAGTLRPGPSLGTGQAQVTLLLRDGQRLWVGTREPATLVFDLERFELLARHPADGLPRFFAPFDAHWMLVGTSHGLHWHGRDGSGPQYRHLADPERPDGLQSSTVSSFLRADDDRLWLATASGGLHQILADDPVAPAAVRFRVYSRGEGPVADTISAVLADDAGRLWMSSSRGVVRFDPDLERFTSFQTADGGLEAGYYSDVRARFDSGLIAFGGPQGFTLLDPQRIAELPPPPPPLLTGLLLDNRIVDPDLDGPLPLPLHLADQLRIPAAQARKLGLRFSAIDFIASPQLRFAYRLDGFDPDWIVSGVSQRQATYTNLAPGHYRFRLRAINQDGASSIDEASLPIEILPAWWQTGWARGLAVLLLVMVALSVHLRRNRRIRRQRRELRQLVEQRTAELSASNAALTNALDELRRTQRSLVEQEKMASLGNLVAGVAHEINTPVGIALTAASHLHETSRNVMGKLASGKLSTSDLTFLHDTISEAMRLVLDSLNRAHRLVTSFKQVAVDQASEQRRRFDLRQFLGEVQQSLQPSYRNSPHTLQVDCPPGIELDTYPGALFHILSNLVANSLLHGFADGRRGCMTIVARAEGDQLLLRYSDDGLGMPADVLAHAFEPFFTTRRGSGGSGLGLNIAYTFATRLLGGQVELHSAPGQGMAMELHMPRVAPLSNVEAEAVQTA